MAARRKFDCKIEVTGNEGPEYQKDVWMPCGELSYFLFF